MDDPNKMHPDDKRNLIVFLVVALCLWFMFDAFLMKPKLEALKEAAKLEQQAAEDTIAIEADASGLASLDDRPRDAVISDTKRLSFDNGKIFGSVALKGGRIDDLSLTDYYDTLEKDDHVQIMSPSGTAHPRYVEMGWLSADPNVKMPDAKTQWSIQGPTAKLSEGQPVVIFWNNGQGLRFERHISVDDQYMMRVEQKVINNADREFRLFPYSLIVQHGLPEDLFGRWIVHEGPIGYLDGELSEFSFKKMRKMDKPEQTTADHGWIGITERHWFVGMIPAKENGAEKYRFAYADGAKGKGKYQVDITGEATLVGLGGEASHAFNVYGGPKKVAVIDHYEDKLDIRHFDLVVDFGLFYIMTKPFFYILTFFGTLTGSIGIGIIILTLLIRLAVFPLANKSYKSFAKLREIAPKMKEMREKHDGDKQALQKDLVKLYEKEKVNPMAGCLPILIQIPIFFAIYKVILISIEVRHEPFFGWIVDLSERDPTSVFNLFGLLPYSVPEFMLIGVWPCLMLIFMLMQRQLNPPPQDPMQAMMVNLMPFFITYILSQFAAALVIYWTFSNALSVIQQYVIMRMMGVEVEFNIFRSKKDKEMAKSVAEGPDVHPELGVIEDEVEKALFDDKIEAEEADEPKKDIKPPKRKPKKKK